MELREVSGEEPTGELGWAGKVREETPVGGGRGHTQVQPAGPGELDVDKDPGGYSRAIYIP